MRQAFEYGLVPREANASNFMPIKEIRTMAKNENLEKYVGIAEKDVNESLETVRKAFAEKDLAGYNKAMATLNEKVKTLNECLCKVKYAEFLAAESPMIAAVKEFYIDAKRVKESHDKNDGSVNGVNLESKKVRIDLEKFCEFGHLDTTWATDCGKLLALLTLRETNVYSIKPADLAKKSFYFIGAANAKKNGETPDSNTQIVRLLQQIIDEAIFVDDGNGKNVYKCTNHDLAFIQDAVTKMDAKEKCTIAMLNERQFKSVMTSVFAHCLGEAYRVKAAKSKNS